MIQLFLHIVRDIELQREDHLHLKISHHLGLGRQPCDKVQDQ